MVSSFLHFVYSGPVTFTQINGYPPIAAMVMGYVFFFLMGFGCSIHIELSLNRLVAVYFPITYKSIFSDRSCRYLLAFNVLFVAALISLFYVVPCNIMGYSASLHGYVILDCPDGSPRNIPIGTAINYFCQYALCIGAIVVDCITLPKIVMINRKRSEHQNEHENRNVRFFIQNFFLNFPMLLHIVFLTISDFSMEDSMEVHRILNFLLGRFAEFVNA
uniref:7TM_GPCR_Srx domain-containing protein n=1 Tax=Steinernema glaseri TaxID=37863 RepID=A0A1I7XVV1_9BILA